MTVKLWEVNDTKNTLKSTLRGHTGPVGSVWFLPSADLAISGSDDKTIRVRKLVSSNKNIVVTILSPSIQSGLEHAQRRVQR